MLTQIVRLTRASAAHLATAQLQGATAARWETAARLYAGMSNLELAAWASAQAKRHAALRDRAMSRHEAARAKLGA